MLVVDTYLTLYVYLYLSMHLHELLCLAVVESVRHHLTLAYHQRG